MYFEVIRNGSRVAVGDRLLNVSMVYEIDKVPSFSVQLPIDYSQHFVLRNEMKLHMPDGGFIHGLYAGKTLTKSSELVSVNYNHTLQEWEYQSIPTNVVKKKASVSSLMKDSDIKYTKNNWVISVQDDAEIEYEFSREKKLEGLDKIISLTPDLHYRILRSTDRYLEIGKFGEHKDFIVSFDNMLDDLTIEDDPSTITNYAVVLSDKNEGGGTSVTLRDVYEHPELQLKGFPVIITGNKINTQSTQTGYSFTEYAPNNMHEYAIIDEVGIEREEGDIYEGTFSMNDVEPVQEDGKTISNADRIKASQMVYQKGVRKLYRSRRNLVYTTTVPDLPLDVNVGDKVLCMFRNSTDTLVECFGLKTTTQLEVQDWFYIVRIEEQMGEDGTMLYGLTLAYDLVTYFNTREY